MHTMVISRALATFRRGTLANKRPGGRESSGALQVVVMAAVYVKVPMPITVGKSTFSYVDSHRPSP